MSDQQDFHQYTSSMPSLSEVSSMAFSCISSGLVAIVVRIANTESKWPIMKENPEAQLHKNWKMAYAAPGDRFAEVQKAKSPIEKDLLQNYVDAFIPLEAAKVYWETGVVPEGTKLGVGLSIAMKIDDYLKLNPGSERYCRNWVTHWTLRDGVKLWIPDESIGNVYAVFVKENKDEQSEHARIIRLLKSIERFV